MSPVAAAQNNNRPRTANQTSDNTHTVRAGETLSGIAQGHDVSLGQLLNANPGIKNPDLIHPGQEVRIPSREPAAAAQPAQEAQTPARPRAKVKPNADGTMPKGGTSKAPPAANAARINAAAIPKGTLRQGSTGVEVQKLQSAMVRLGHMSQAKMNTGPGTFGPATEAAVKDFQRTKGLEDDGVYGPKTRAALEGALGGKPAAPKPDAPKADGPKPDPVKPAPGPGGTVAKPPVISAPSPNQNSRNGTDIDTIVLHHTASNNGKGDLAHMRNPGSEVSAHYMVDRDGKIYQLVDDQKRAWHAGAGGLPGQAASDVNGRSIGIEIVNDGSGKTAFTEAQYRALEQLVPHLAQKYNVPDKNLLGHRDVARPRGRKNDPAANFDWGRIRGAVDQAR